LKKRPRERELQPSAQRMHSTANNWEIATVEMPRWGFNAHPPPSERCPTESAETMQECTAADFRIRPTAKDAYERILDIPPV
jgi:hypothetical protein